MKHGFDFHTCLLLLCMLTAPVSCDKDEKAVEVIVSEVPEGIKLSCSKGYLINQKESSITLPYSDENTGEYTCYPPESPEGSAESKVGPKIFVKFRTCDNCVEFDTTAIAGMVVGNLVATILVGAAVYVVASQPRTGAVSSHKKSSDRQHLVPNDMSSRGPNGLYQPLKGRQKETYDVLNRK